MSARVEVTDDGHGPVYIVEIPGGENRSSFAEVSLIRGSQIALEPIDWLWPGWLASGKLHLIAGAPGTGKTSIALAMAAILTSGGAWPDGSRATPGKVLIWSAEDDPSDTLLPRLTACGANLDNVFIVSGVSEGSESRPFDPSIDMEALFRAARQQEMVKLLIVDPMVSVVTGDSHKNGEVRRGLQPLVDFGAEIGCAVLGIGHFAKGTSNRDPIERVTGSIAFGALPRIVLGTVKRSVANGGGRLLVRAKSNIGPDSDGFHYDIKLIALQDHEEIVASCVEWDELVVGEARDLLAQAETAPDSGNASALNEAKSWLKETLKSKDIDGKKLKEMAGEAGISERTLYRAANKIGVKMLPNGYGSPRIWHICDLSATECHVCHPIFKGTHEPFGADGNVDGDLEQ